MKNESKVKMIIGGGAVGGEKLSVQFFAVVVAQLAA
jgi:hypothetical protein